ncbi:protein NDNF-like [Battus philenor]|uniref:protein NDNF-like n=1 Tax=Battus philenor TaxID=42288 RepID=UPI0035CFB1A4
MNMGNISSLTTRLAVLIALHAAGVGLASPSVLVTRPVSRFNRQWLPMDNQTLYKLERDESRSLELNTSMIADTHVYITISPCSSSFHWGLYHGIASDSEGNLKLLEEYEGVEIKTLSVVIRRQEKYILQLTSLSGGTVVVSVRGESTRRVRMRLRVRSRRRLSANWDPSPIDPQSTTYCVVASHRKNYTSLCAAQSDVRASRLENKSSRSNSEENRSNPEMDGSHQRESNNSATYHSSSVEVDNKVELDIDGYNVYEGTFKNVYRKKKFGRSTKVSSEDPLIACVGDRTHHVIENLDPSTTYFVSVFGVSRDRRAGSLLATGSVRPRTSTAKRLRENVPLRNEIKGKSIYYFKATVGTSGGIWVAISTCGGAVDIEVLVKGKRVYTVKSIEPHAKFFVPAPSLSSSAQETSDEGSVQFDSSSEESKIRYVIRVLVSKWNRDDAVNVELVASTSRWGISSPELIDDGGIVRELRPKRSCKSVDVAFLPATHNATDVIRYCIVAKESPNRENECTSTKKSFKAQCVNHMQRQPARVIIKKVTGLKPGRKYAIQVTASNKGFSVPYNILYVDTNASCKEE